MKAKIATTGQLGPVLKRLRQDRGLSQTALGAKIGLSQERISRIEGRPESVTLDNLMTVLMALDASLFVDALKNPDLEKPADNPDPPNQQGPQTTKRSKW